LAGSPPCRAVYLTGLGGVVVSGGTRRAPEQPTWSGPSVRGIRPASHRIGGAGGPQREEAMTEIPKRMLVAMSPGYFTVPDDPAEPPKLLGSRCQACGEHFYPRRVICAKCLSDQMAEVEMGPRGTLYSYTFVHFPLFGSTRMEHVGYGVGQVDLPEGPRVQVPLAGAQEDFRVGQTVEAELDSLREEEGRDVVIVRFRPVERAR
jgi:uncharacterized OB-fold protein